MPSVQFFVPLFAGELHLPGIDHDNDVSVVLVRCVRGLVFTLHSWQTMA